MTKTKENTDPSSQSFMIRDVQGELMVCSQLDGVSRGAILDLLRPKAVAGH